MAARRQMVFQHRPKNVVHVDVRRMHLVDHQQVAQQSGCSSRGVLDEQATQENLVDGPDDDLSGQILAWRFRCPAGQLPLGIRIVVPQNLEAADRVARNTACLDIAGNR